MTPKERCVWMSVVVSILCMGHCNRSIRSDITNKHKYVHLFQEAYRTVLTHFHKPSALNTRLLFHGALKGMFQALGDPHSEFLDEEHFTLLQDTVRGSFAGLGLHLIHQNQEYYVSHMVPHSPAAQANIKVHDQLTHINMQDIRTWSFPQVIRALRGNPGSQITLTLTRKDTQAHITLTRKALDSTQVIHTVLPYHIGYIQLTDFSHSSPTKVKHALQALKQQGIKALIFDLRSNPGGDPISCLRIINYFFNDKRKLLQIYNSSQKTKRSYYSIPGKAIFPDIALAILSNGSSASASEIFMGAIQDHQRGVIIGQKTYGKGLVQIYKASSIHSSVGFKITHAQWLTPNSNIIHNKGITPNILTEQIALTPTEQQTLKKLHTSKLIQDFIHKHPTLTPQEQELFVKLAHNKGYSLKRETLLYFLTIKQHTHKQVILLDSKNDPTLYEGFSYLKALL